MAQQTNNTDPPTGMTLSAVVRVEKSWEIELRDCTEFHVDCLTQDSFGESLEIDLYFGLSKPEEIAALKNQLKIGAIFSVKDEPVSWEGGHIRLLLPTLLPFLGDMEPFNKVDNSRNTDGIFHGSDSQRLKGCLTDYRVMETKRSGPMGLALILIESGVIEGFLFPEIHQRYSSRMKIGEEYSFTGEITPEEETADGVAKLVVDTIGFPEKEVCHEQ